MINKPFRAKKKQFDGKGEWVYGWLVELSKDSFSDEKRYGRRNNMVDKYKVITYAVAHALKMSF